MLIFITLKTAYRLFYLKEKQLFLTFTEGCPGDCGVHGQCRQEVSDEAVETWSCVCSYGWKGANCNIEVETQCNDGIDNDLGSYTFSICLSKSKQF